MTEQPDHVVERNIALLGDVMRYLLAKPHVMGSLPDSFELVILPDDDPALRLYNLELLDRYEGEGKPIVFALMKSGHTPDGEMIPPHLYVPVAA
jgi:hypothetical protein